MSKRPHRCAGSHRVKFQCSVSSCVRTARYNPSDRSEKCASVPCLATVPRHRCARCRTVPHGAANGAARCRESIQHLESTMPHGAALFIDKKKLTFFFFFFHLLRHRAAPLIPSVESTCGTVRHRSRHRAAPSRGTVRHRAAPCGTVRNGAAAPSRGTVARHRRAAPSRGTVARHCTVRHRRAAPSRGTVARHRRAAPSRGTVILSGISPVSGPLQCPQPHPGCTAIR